MWTEDRVRAALAKKQERLEEAEHRMTMLRDFLHAEVVAKEAGDACALAEELRDQVKHVEKIKNQIEVLNYILDN